MNHFIKCISCFDIFGIFCKKKKSFLLQKEEYNELLYDDECGICLDLLKGSPCIKTEKCNHIFHKYCYKKYLKQTKIKNELSCPYCNSNQDNLNIFIIETD
jgi:hypothetical protein